MAKIYNIEDYRNPEPDEPNELRKKYQALLQEFLKLKELHPDIENHPDLGLAFAFGGCIRILTEVAPGRTNGTEENYEFNKKCLKKLQNNL